MTALGRPMSKNKQHIKGFQEEGLLDLLIVLYNSYKSCHIFDGMYANSTFLGHMTLYQ